MVSSLCCIGGCLPGLYTSRPAASGVVVDAVTDAPLPGVMVSYDGERVLTDEHGSFCFSKRTGVALYYLGGESPEWGRVFFISFSREGYTSKNGQLGELSEEGKEGRKVKLKKAVQEPPN